MNADAGEPVRTMYLRDFSCSSALIGGGGKVCERLEFRRVGVDESNGGLVEVVGGGGCEIIEFRRVGGGGGGNLEFGLFIIIECELG